MVRALVLSILLGGATAWASPAEDLMRAGRLGDAIPVARAEAEAAPDDLAAQERYIDLLLSLNLFEVVQALYQRRVDAAPQSADAHYLLGRAVPTAAAAKTHYGAALGLDPRHARAQMGMGSVARATGDLAAAEVSYRRALELDAHLAEAWAGLAATQAQQGRPAVALATARQALAAVPDEPDPYLTVALLAPAEAASVLATGTRRVPGDPRLHAMLAEVRLAAGDGKGAASAAASALVLNPDHADARRWAGFAAALQAGVLDGAGFVDVRQARALELGDPVAASASWDALVGRYPRCALVFMGRARVRSARGQLPGALADLDRAVALTPDDTEAVAARGLVLLASARPADAVAPLAKAAQARPSDASLQLAWAQSLAASGQMMEARRVLGSATAAHPMDSRLVLLYAQVLSTSGAREEAYRELGAAVKRLPEQRLLLAYAAAARDAGHYEEAALAVEDLARQTGAEQLLETAKKLRAMKP